MAVKKTAEIINAELENLASRLDAIATEATGLGEERVARSIANAAKSARSAIKQRAVRFKRVGSIIEGPERRGDRRAVHPLAGT